MEVTTSFTDRSTWQ